MSAANAAKPSDAGKKAWKLSALSHSGIIKSVSLSYICVELEGYTNVGNPTVFVFDVFSVVPEYVTRLCGKKSCDTIKMLS